MPSTTGARALGRAAALLRAVSIRTNQEKKGSKEGEVVLTVEAAMEELANIVDPELGLDFVELGLIYGVEIDAGAVHVTYTLTAPGCPIAHLVPDQIEEFVGEIDGVESVTSTLVFDPPWTPEKMSEDAKFALGF